MTQVEVCRRLLAEAEDLRYDDPREAVRLAEKVRDRAAALNKEALGAPRWTALQADAWAVLGSALRSVSDLQQAEGALNVALAFLDSPEAYPPQDPLAHARLAQRAAYLRCDQRRFTEALELIEEAITVYRECGEEQPASGALADRGLILGRAGRRQEAVADLAEALERLEPQWSLRHFQAAIHNMAVNLHELATTREADRLAREWLELARRCHAAFPEKINLLKLDALRGMTAIRCGDLDEGTRRLWQSQAGFQDLGAAYEQALILLRLASAYLGQGLVSEVKRVAGRLFPVFHTLRVDREASAALMLFYNAAQTETATLDLVDRASEILTVGLDIEPVSRRL